MNSFMNSSETKNRNTVRYDDASPGLSNLINIHALVTGDSPESIEQQFEGKMYSDFKCELGDALVEYLSPFQKKYNEIISDKEYLSSILVKGSDTASYRARKTMSKVYRKVGFIPKEFKQ